MTKYIILYESYPKAPKKFDHLALEQMNKHLQQKRSNGHVLNAKNIWAFEPIDGLQPQREREREFLETPKKKKKTNIENEGAEKIKPFLAWIIIKIYNLALKQQNKHGQQKRSDGHFINVKKHKWTAREKKKDIYCPN